jgi:hypothetical protein
MRIKMTARETLIMSRDEIYEVPDNIGAQILRRCHAVEIVEEKKKAKKE